MSQHENELESLTEYTREYLAGAAAIRRDMGKDPNGWYWKDKGPDTDAMPTPTKWTYTPTPPVTPEEDEYFKGYPWNNDTYMGAHGEQVKYSPKQQEKIAQRGYHMVVDPMDTYTRVEGRIDPLPESARVIAAECDRIKAFLIEKNLAYGNSALQPVRIFSQADTVEQLLVRIDDKLSRMQRGFEHGDDDTTLDLLGYLILLRIAVKKDGK